MYWLTHAHHYPDQYRGWNMHCIDRRSATADDDHHRGVKLVTYLLLVTGTILYIQVVNTVLLMIHYNPAKRKASSESPCFNCSLEIAIKRIRITSTPGEIRSAQPSSIHPSIICCLTCIIYTYSHIVHCMHIQQQVEERLAGTTGFDGGAPICCRVDRQPCLRNS